MKYKCNSCYKEFDEYQVKEWLSEDGDIDDLDGDVPCCPYCGSDNVEEE